MSPGVESTAWLPLTPGERVLWAGTPSMYPAVPAAALGFALSMLGVWLSRAVEVPAPAWLPLGLVPIGVLVGAWAYLARWSTRYVFTTKAVYEKTGMFSLTVTRVALDRVQNTALSQSPAQRVLSYGDIGVYTAGTGGVDLSLRDVPDAGRVNALVTAQLGESTLQPATERPATGGDRPTL